MKTIIMAGGEGSRLRPVTCGLPKPMAPLANKPMMEHIIDLLKKNSCSDIGVTLQYMPESIRNYFSDGAEFGVKMRYFVEETPLGTAGSVKNAQDFLDETFLVISGDALTDIDLSQAMDFHRRQGALATIVLTRVNCPLEYGVVITGSSGEIIRFLEKPAWGEVFSDLVNTGIYILEPEVLDYIPGKGMFDFSKDLFPLLLKKKKPLLGIALKGYWCDVGNLTQYLDAHQDVLTGKVCVSIPAQELNPGIWTGESVDIHPQARLKGPVIIGDGAYIGKDAVIEPYTVIGNGCLIQEKASLKRSVLWNNVYVGKNASLRGAVICSRTQIQAAAEIYEGAVVGSDSVLQEHSLVKPEVKLWPSKLVETGSVVNSSLIWGTRNPKKIFGLEGVTGLVNVEITPEYACKLGAAFSAATGNGLKKFAVSADNYPSSQMIKEALAIGIQSTGATIYDLGQAITPMHRFAVRSLNLTAGVHVKVSHRRSDQVVLIFVNDKGGNISRNVERKIENLLSREDFPRADMGKISPREIITGMAENYLSGLLRQFNNASLREARLRLIMAYNTRNLGYFMEKIGEGLNMDIENLDISDADELPLSWEEYQKNLSFLAEKVYRAGANAGAIIDPNADRLVLVDERGRVIQDSLLTVLIALITMKAHHGPVVVPVTTPRVVENLARHYNSQVIWSKTAVQDLSDKFLGLDDKQREEGISLPSQFMLNFDALSALTGIMGFAAQNNLTLSALVDEIPSFFVCQREIPVSWETKGRVIRNLIEEPDESDMELLDGVKVFHQNGWALVLPDPEEPVCRIYSEGASMEIAESLADFYLDKISEIIKST